MPFDPGIRVLDDPDVPRLIADPLRLRILELLRQEPRTVTELAGLLGVARTRLYYHVRLLESHDLIAVAETQVVAGITEKRYRVTAYRLSVDKSLLGPASGEEAPLDVFLSVVLDEVAAEIRRAVASGLIDLDAPGEDQGAGLDITPRRLSLGRDWYRFNPADIQEFAREYQAFWRRFADRTVDLIEGRPVLGGDVSTDDAPKPDNAPKPDDDRRLYEFLVGFYPVVEPSGDPEPER